MQELKTSIGTRIRELRQEKGWTQDYLAYFANTGTATIVNLENGKCGLSLLTLVKITTALEKPINSIFNEPTDQL